MKQYHVSVNGQQPSVVAEDVLAKEAAAGKYPENTLVWCEGMAGWEPIGNHFRRPASPPPIPAAASAAACALPAGKPDVAQENQALELPRTTACHHIFEEALRLCAGELSRRLGILPTGL